MINETISYLFPEEEKNESHLFGLQWFSAKNMMKQNDKTVNFLFIFIYFTFSRSLTSLYCWQAPDNCEMFGKLLLTTWSSTIFSITFTYIA